MSESLVLGLLGGFLGWGVSAGLLQIALPWLLDTMCADSSTFAPILRWTYCASFAKASPEAPTTRGFASILAQGLAGLSVEQVLDVPDDYPLTLGLTEAVSPLLHALFTT